MKKSIIPVAAFIAGMAIVPSVFALDNAKTYTQWTAEGGKGLDACLYSDEEDATCKIGGTAKEVAVSSGYAIISSSKTLDLGGKTLVLNGFQQDAPLHVTDGATLTIVNGTIKQNVASKYAVEVSDGATLVVADNVKIEGINPVHVSGARQVTINGELNAGEGSGSTALNVVGTTAEADDATIVEVNGKLVAEGAAKAYAQENKVTATIKGEVSSKTTSAMSITGGSLTLTGADVESDSSAIVLGKTVDALVINGCSNIVSNKLDAAIWFANGAKVNNLTINNSTLESTKGNTINGGTGASVDAVEIAGSKLIAGAEKAIKAGDIEFEAATYDGTEVKKGDKILTEATHTYGTLATVCTGAEADKPADDNKDDGAENPNTADTIATYLTIATVALLGLGATAFVAKKSNR